MKRSVSCNIPLFLAFILTCSGQECHLVQPCGPGIVVDKSQIGGLLYVVPDGSQLMMDLCPRTDISQWVIEVTTNGGQTLEGTYCIGRVIFNSSVACLYNNGLLAFIDLSSFLDKIGVLDLMFNSPSFNTTITIRYAKPGIVPAMTVRYFNEGEQVVLEYFMYTSDNVFNDSLIHNNVPLTNKDTILSPAAVIQRFPDTFTCKDAESSESTIVLKFLLQDATIASAGVYELVNGVDSASITLIANFTATPTPPSMNPTSSSSSDLITTDTSTASTTDTSTTGTTGTSTTSTYSTLGSVPSLSPTSSSESPSMVPDDSSDLAAIISGSVVAVVVVLIISIVIVIIVIAICRTCISTKTSVEETTDNNSEHRGNVRLRSFDKKPDEVIVPGGPDTVEVPFSTSHNNNGISNGGPNTEHDIPQSTVLDSSTVSASSQDNEGGTVTDRKPHPSADINSRPSVDENLRPSTDKTIPHPSTDRDRKIKEYSQAEATVPSVNPNLQVNVQVNELLDIERERLKLEQERLEVAKEQKEYLKELVNVNVQSNQKREIEHKETKEIQEELLETNRDMVGTLERSLATEPEGVNTTGYHGDNTNGYHGDNTTGCHGDNMNYLGDDNSSDDHEESIKPINNNTISTDTHQHLLNDLSSDSNNEMEDSKEDDVDNHHDND